MARILPLPFPRIGAGLPEALHSTSGPARIDSPVVAGSPGPGSDKIGYGLTVLVLSLAAGVVFRGCGYEVPAILLYAGYLGLQVVLPGAIVLLLVGIRPLSLPILIALGLPIGFAVEVFSFLSLSAVHLHPLMAAMPVFWIGLTIASRARMSRLAECRLGAGNGWVALALSSILLAVVLTAAGNLFSESPLADSLPQRPIFHDWVYLLSRSAVLKLGAPFEDPSLAGTPLQYHYFLLVHVASASSATGIDVTTVLLRLALLPLAAALIAQAYVLGKGVTGNRWAGVLAATLLFVPGELSSSAEYNHLTYLGFFVRWLYVSPTFFFGLTYLGALLIALHGVQMVPWKRMLILGLLAAAGTGAKGSVMPVLLTAVVGLALWTWATTRRFPWRLALAAAVMSMAFIVVYQLALSACGCGDPSLEPFRVCRLSQFWQDHEVPVARFLKRTLHAPNLGTWLAWTLTAAGVLAGTAGIRLVAIVSCLGNRSAQSKRLVQLLGATVVASCVFGLALRLDGDSEVYFLFLAQLPLAALAGAGVLTLGQRARASWRAAALERSAFLVFARRTVVIGAAAGLVAVFCGQTATTLRCETPGLLSWLRFKPGTAINEDLRPMYETMRWLRSNTQPDAVLVGNAFTARNLGQDRGVSVDHTTVGVYYYYSALAERRVWVEGPTYAMNPAEARSRTEASGAFFYAGRALPSIGRPVYAVLDHSLNDKATVPTSGALRVFANRRFEVYRIETPKSAEAAKPKRPGAQS